MVEDLEQKTTILNCSWKFWWHSITAQVRLAFTRTGAVMRIFSRALCMKQTQPGFWKKQWRFQSEKDRVGERNPTVSEKTLSSALTLLGEPLNIDLARGTSKRYTRRETKGVTQPNIWLRFTGTCDIRQFLTKVFLTSGCLFLITFTTKLYPRSETPEHANFLHSTKKSCFFRAKFWFVRRKWHARFRSVLYLYQVMV